LRTQSVKRNKKGTERNNGEEENEKERTTNRNSREGYKGVFCTNEINTTGRTEVL